MQSSICNDLNSSREVVPVRTGTYPRFGTVIVRGLMFRVPLLFPRNCKFKSLGLDAQ
jgi:hypothetical protein